MSVSAKLAEQMRTQMARAEQAEHSLKLMTKRAETAEAQLAERTTVAEQLQEALHVRDTQLAAATQRDEQRRVLLDDAQVLARDAQRRAADAEIALAAAIKRAEAAEAQLAAVPSKAIYDCWYHSDGQTPDESATAVEAWLVSTGVMDKYYRA